MVNISCHHLTEFKKQTAIPELISQFLDQQTASSLDYVYILTLPGREK